MRNAVAALALLTLAACDPDEGLRTQPPATDPGIDVRVPRIRTATMQSGMPVYLAKGSSVRIAAVGLLLRAGPHYDPPGKEGLARLTAELIESGTARNGVQHREHFEALGTDLHVAVSPESILLAVEVFSDETPLALRTLAGLMRDPSIAVDELENARRERSNNIARMIESPDALASLAMAEAVLRERNLRSAWGLGTEASVGRITADDVIAHLGRAADPGRAAVVIVGDVGEKEANEWVRVAFGDWRGGVAAGPSALSEPPPPMKREAIVFVPVPGLERALIGFGGPDLPADDSREPALALAKEVALSVVNDELRRRRHTSYGAKLEQSSFAGGSAFSIVARVQPDKVAASINGVLSTLNGVAYVGDSLNRHRIHSYVDLMTDSQEVRSVVGTVRTIFDHGYPRDVYETRYQRLGALEARQIHEMLRLRFGSRDVQVVVVGDPAIHWQLKSVDNVIVRLPEELVGRTAN